MVMLLARVPVLSMLVCVLWLAGMFHLCLGCQATTVGWSRLVPWVAALVLRRQIAWLRAA